MQPIRLWGLVQSLWGHEHYRFVITELVSLLSFLKSCMSRQSFIFNASKFVLWNMNGHFKGRYVMFACCFIASGFLFSWKWPDWLLLHFQEMGRNKKINNHSIFWKWIKSYETTFRELLWKILINATIVSLLDHH